MVSPRNPDRIMTESPGILLSCKRIVQIAGIANANEARMLVACGADFLGFPLGPAGGKDDAGEKDAERIIRALRPPAYGVLITYSNLAGAIATLCRNLRVSIVQLHGDIALGEVRRLKETSPGLFIVKTLVVRKSNLPPLLDDVDRFGEHADAFMTDTFDEGTGRWGATGKTHDWSISRRIVERAQRPVILAGGLTPENVYRAITDVGPAGVDVHTGVEDVAGRKDRGRVERFVAQARKAFDSI